MSTHAPESQEFFELVQRTSRYLRRHTLLVGGVLVLLATIGWLTCAVAVDLLMPLTTAGRVSFAVGFWLLLLGTSAALLGWPALRRLKLEDVALGIERAIGGMHNRLLTVLDLHRADQQAAAKANPEMVARLMSQTRAKLAGFRMAHLVNRAALMRSLSALGGVLLVAALLAAAFWDRAPTALARILRPTADIAPVTWLRIEAPGDLQVAHGDPLTLGAEITRGAAAELSLHLQQPDGRWVTYPMQSAGAHSFAYTLNGITADYRYKISGGGTWTGVYRIQQVPRPVVESLTAAVRLPRYMQRDELLPVPDDAKRIEAPLDSRILLTATVSGDVAGGEILLLKRTVSISEQVQEEECVWFEDELPADAATENPWRWSTTQVRTGLKAFTFGRSRQSFGFTTRLNPLHVPVDATVYLYVWLDPADPPGWISVNLEQEKRGQTVEWGDAPASATRDRKRSAYVGPLPAPGRWVRLEVPVKRLGGDKSGLKLKGLSLAIDRGQVFFDRPGFLTRKSQSVEMVKLEQVAEFPMTKDEAADRWSGQLSVEGSGLCTVRFHSSLKQSSAEREPLEIVATKDQPPSLVVEKPAQDVVLPEPQPLHVTGRALDDWGIETVGIQVGPSATTLGPVRWQPRTEKFATSRGIVVTIDPQAEHLSPGESLMYRLVAKDCHGQVAESQTYKLSIATPDKVAAPETAKQPESLDKLVETVDRMEESARKEKEATAFLDSLPAELRDAVDEKGSFKKPDGSDMSREEIQKLVGDAHQQLSAEQRQRLAELTAELNKRQQEMQRLADKLDQAAKEAEKNPLATNQEAELLKVAANQAAGMATQLSPPTASQGEPAALERVLKSQQLAADQPQQLAELEQQLRQLEAARKQMASDPQLARQMLDAQAARQQAAAAAQQLHELADAMQAREKQLNSIEEQEAGLNEKGKRADGKQLDALSKQQTKLDEKALAAVDDLRRDLGRKPTDEKGALAPRRHQASRLIPRPPKTTRPTRRKPRIFQKLRAIRNRRRSRKRNPRRSPTPQKWKARGTSQFRRPMPPNRRANWGRPKKRATGLSMRQRTSPTTSPRRKTLPARRHTAKRCASDWAPTRLKCDKP